MLRTLITFAAALILLLAAFFVFVVWKAQPNAPTTRPITEDQRPTPVTPTNSVIGNGRSATWDQFKDGRLESEFSAAEYTPNKDGSFEVTKPVDVFYMSDGQCLRVTGDTGHLNCETPAQTSLTGMTNTNMSPRNGWLQNVKLELYKYSDPEHVSLTMTTNNINFDNDTLLIYTQSYTDPVTNKIVSADQVPVTIRGDEYEFDGNGLSLVWNGKTRRLQKLLVNHGKRLEIKNPTKITLPGMAPAQPPAKVALSPSPGTPEGSSIAGWGAGASEISNSEFEIRNHPQRNPQSEILASTDPRDVMLAINTKPTVPEPPTLYRAVFNDNVKIADEVRTLATADLMIVDFLQGSTPAKPAPVSPAVPTLSTAPAAAAPTVGSPPVAATMSATTSPSTKPATTKPINGPVTITWTGELLVVPLESEPPMMPITPGQSVVRLVGKPVHLTPEGSEIWATSATYRSPDGAVKLESSADAPVAMNRGNGQMTLSTRGIDYNPDTSIATLFGVSHLSVPVGKSTMTVDWQKQGLLHMVKLPGQSQPSGVDHVDLSSGAEDVVVKHPQFQMQSQELQLDLVPADGKPAEGGEQLKAVTADGNVQCGLPELGSKIKQGINSDHLVIRTQMHNKQPVIRELVADGNVNAFDPEQTIKAGHLDAFLVPKPTTMPASHPATNPADTDAATAVDLESLNASDHVHAKLKNNATADSDELHISGNGKDQQISLKGAEPVTLADGKGASLAGRDIQLSPANSGVKVSGPGTLKTPRRSSTTQPATAPAQPVKPIIVTWEKSLNMVGNDVDVIGQVHVENTDANGTFSEVTGDTAHLDLIDAPKDPKKQPTTAKSKSEDDSAIGGKQLKKLTLTGHIIGNSDLYAPDGSVLRQGVLRCNERDQLVYTADNGQAIILGPGSVLVENHLADKGDPTGNKGAMAIRWQKQMVYDQKANTITFTGSTIVGFQQDPANAKPVNPQTKAPPVGQGKMNLMADQVVITMASSPTTKPMAQPQQKMQVSKMQAMGSVRFIATGADMTCVTADYNPATSILTASGDDSQDVQVTTGNMTGSFKQVQYDSARQEIVSTTGSHIKTSN